MNAQSLPRSVYFLCFLSLLCFLCLLSPLSGWLSPRCFAQGSATGGGGGTAAVVAPTITTPEIITQTMAASVLCSAYRVVGVCVWLTYVPPAEYGIETTVKVGHYIPDVVVASYRNTGQTPWRDSRPLVAATTAAAHGLFGSLLGGFALGGGNSINGDSTPQDTGRVKFKNVDVIGNPSLAAWGSSDMRCGTVATLLQPYFVSNIDLLAWRFGIPEMAYPMSYLPLLHNIGRGASQWGSVYPRTGSLVSNHDYKTGAVMAERAGDVVTRPAQPHVYTSLFVPPGMTHDAYRWPPPPLVEGDAKTGWWQMLLPHPETSCYVFADVDDALMGPVDPNAQRMNPFEDYLWNLWRPYACCSRPPHGVALITSTGTFP